MACDPNTLLAQATQFLALSPGEVAGGIIAALVEVAEGGGVAAGDFRITQLSEVRITQAGDSRIIQ